MGYHRAETISQALASLAMGAVPVAGGTDWYPSFGDRPLPDDILDITTLPGFRGITRTDSGWRIGAATTWTDILRADLPPAFDGLKAAAREVGSVQIQNVGTVGGNLCNASPAADGMPPLLCLDPQVTLVGPNGTRTLPLLKFVTGVRQTALADGALLEAIHIPDPGQGAQGSFVKLGARKYLVISIAMVSVLARVDKGQIADLRIAVGACSAVAQRVTALEQALIGATPDQVDALITSKHLTNLSPIDDIRGDAGYRTEAAMALIRRALHLVTDQGADHG